MNINWQTVVINLRHNYRSLSTVAREIGSNERHLNGIARGGIKEPKWSTGHKLLDLHHEKCEKHHNKESLIMRVNL